MAAYDDSAHDWHRKGVVYNESGDVDCCFSAICPVYVRQRKAVAKPNGDLTLASSTSAMHNLYGQSKVDPLLLPCIFVSDGNAI